MTMSESSRSYTSNIGVVDVAAVAVAVAGVNSSRQWVVDGGQWIVESG